LGRGAKLQRRWFAEIPRIDQSIKRMMLEVVATMQSGEAALMEAREAQRRGAKRQTDG
jgi:hypothetical protein